MPNYNKVLIMGHLTRDPQLTYLPSQTAVADFGIAVNHSWKGSDGQAKEEVCFVDCRTFGKQAETFNKYMAKGKPVFIDGRLTLDSWTGKDGSAKNKLRITVESFQFVGGKDGIAAEPRANQEELPLTQDREEGRPPEDDIPF